MIGGTAFVNYYGMTPNLTTPQNIIHSTSIDPDEAKKAFEDFIENEMFPCVAAKAALNKDHLKTFVAGHIACPKDDHQILEFIYDFVDGYRNSDAPFHSACVIFPEAEGLNEEFFERFLWMRLQALSNLDSEKYPYDKRVSDEPHSENFSFSLKEEAFFIIGLSPFSPREARRFQYPALVFNPHHQFEEMRSLRRYDKMKNIVRKRDIALSGSINPMLNDFGDASEAYQYSGMKYDSNWECPFKYKSI